MQEVLQNTGDKREEKVALTVECPASLDECLGMSSLTREALSRLESEVA